MRPESAKLATRTEVAELDCKIAVDTVPKRTPFTGLEVREAKSELILCPAIFLTSLPKDTTLNRKRETEPIIPRSALKMFIIITKLE